MEPAGYVGQVDNLEQLCVRPHLPGTKTFTDVAVDQHIYPLKKNDLILTQSDQSVGCRSEDDNLVAMIELACPICQETLDSQHSTLRCPRGHAFDRAKEGYVNLLPAHAKRSKHPGDDKAMLQARRRFLNAGHYQPLMELLDQFDHRGNGLDLGCGDGWYSKGLGCNAGVDISKDAIKMAAKASKGSDIQWVVASSAHLPFAANQFDWVLSVFAPLYPEAVRAVTRPQARVLWVGPAPNHLNELQSLIYDAPQPHTTQAPKG